jgi:hypothetical protein
MYSAFAGAASRAAYLPNPGAHLKRLHAHYGSKKHRREAELTPYGGILRAAVSLQILNFD